jgi:outer membrane protein assembly factor BamB
VVTENWLVPLAIVSVEKQNLLLATDRRGRTFAFDAETGEGKWSISIGGERPYDASKIDAGNAQFAGAVGIVGSTPVLLAPSTTGAQAFDAATGRMLWSLPLEHGIITSAIAFDLNGRGDDDFIITTDEPSVKVLEAKTGAVVSESKLSAMPIAPPAGYRRGRMGEFALVLEGGLVQLYNRHSAPVRSARFGPGLDGRSFTIANAPESLLLFADRGRLMAIKTATLSPIWTIEIPGDRSNGRLAQVASVGGAGGMTVVSTLDGRLARVDVKSGKLLWETKIPPGADLALVSDVDHDHQTDVVAVAGAERLTVISGMDGRRLLSSLTEDQQNGVLNSQRSGATVFGTINESSWIYSSDESGPGLQGVRVMSLSLGDTGVANSVRQIRQKE